ncbi:MAG: hypothetical protein BYD32DRAFT_437273 [Podila humilis]|nr:MAG: hypothetical protein BYD32DRAFT_437273 [Podila humilis]
MLSRLGDSTVGLKVEGYVLFPFLETYTATSQTTDFAHFHSRDVRKALDDHEIILNSLQPFNFPCKESSDDTKIASTVSLSTRLQDLKISSFCKAGSVILAAIQEACRTVQTFCLSGDFCMAGPGKLPILCETKHLNYFQTTDQIHSTVQWPFLSAETLDFQVGVINSQNAPSPVSSVSDRRPCVSSRD